MFRKHYKKLAEILENKCDSTWCIIEIADFLEASFDNFDREKFLLACGFDKAYTYDELLAEYFVLVDKLTIQL